MSNGFEKNFSILNDSQKKAGELLLSIGQEHIFKDWPAPGERDADKKRLLDQTTNLESHFPGGLKHYVERARKLLEEAKEGKNPYEGYFPEVPHGFTLETKSKEGLDQFNQLEAKGVGELGYTAFVLVAGGLGERLGYSGIKVELPAEITTEVCYLQYYVSFIQAYQARARRELKDSKLVIPLAIMTSGDTHEKTVKLLEEHKNFGLEEGQLTIVKQELVPALLDNAAHFALDEHDSYQISTKPHGHGDVHTLLYTSGLADKWAKDNRRWVVFFQDTNGLVFRALPAAIGASAQNKMDVNSLTVPRRPGEAVGAICRLVSKDHKMTINVEYNQLDDLLRASGIKDEVDAQGYSKFPGNINVLIFNIPKYAHELHKTHGIISEFVNPKYADKEKTVFKKPTRLECMMQDYPKTISGESVVGSTQIERWLSFSAVKNQIGEAIAKQKQTGYPESASSGEADIYYCNRKLLSLAGVEIDVEGKEVEYAGIKVNQGARVVLSPSFGVTLAEIQSKIRPGGTIKISNNSTLILDGENITISNLTLDGTLVIQASAQSHVDVNGLTVHNKGWEFVKLSDGDKSIPEKYIIRGYTLIKHEQAEYHFNDDKPHLLSDDDDQPKDGSPSKKVKVSHE